ncbi:peptide-methionine (S)-S-oxide reductase [Idiomarina zobellii]|nr:peptide-methionine (S)-S-oxide reductase [Idiomarina zobellii]
MAANKTEQATLGGGCFWCVESAFLQVKGIESVKSGYTGGHTENPTYEQVCTGDTGHAEVAQLTYDPQQISYRQILEIFFTLHDPTQVNRQGNDVGTQYRTSIFYHDEAQKQEPRALLRN